MIDTGTDTEAIRICLYLAAPLAALLLGLGVVAESFRTRPVSFFARLCSGAPPVQPRTQESTDARQESP